MKVQWICITSAVVSTTATGAPLAVFNPQQRTSYMGPPAIRLNTPPRFDRRWLHAGLSTTLDYPWAAVAKAKSFAGFGPVTSTTKEAPIAGKESIAAVNQPKEFLSPGHPHPVSQLHPKVPDDHEIVPRLNQATPDAISENAKPVSNDPPPNAPESKAIPLVGKLKTQLSAKNLEWVKNLKVKGFWKRLKKALQDWYNASTKKVTPGAKLHEPNQAAKPENLEVPSSEPVTLHNGHVDEALHAPEDRPSSLTANLNDNKEHTTTPPRQASYLDRLWPTEENSAIYRWWYQTHPQSPHSPTAPPQIAESTPNHFGNLKSMKPQNSLEDSAKKFKPDEKLPETEDVPETEHLASNFRNVATPSKGKTVLGLHESEAGPSGTKAIPGNEENFARRPPVRQESLSNKLQSSIGNSAFYKWLYEAHPESPHPPTTSASSLSHVSGPTPSAGETTLEGEMVQNALALIDTKELALMAHSSVWEGGPPLKFLAAITSNAAVERMLQSLIDSFALKLERKLQEFQVAPRVLTVVNEALKKAKANS